MSKINLQQGDCIDEMKEIVDGSVDVVLTDPPYGTTACKWDSIIPLEPMWEQLRRITKPNGVIAMTASQPFSSVLTVSNLPMFKHEWVWLKNRGSNFANTVREPMKEHEVVLIFSNGKWVYNRQMQKRTGGGLGRAKYTVEHNNQDREGTMKFEGRAHHKISDLRIPSTWQKFNVASGGEKVKHPTQKPVALMEYLIKTYTNEDETVLDFAMGSGTTGVACKNLNRNFIGIEKDEEYFKIAEKRINENI
jgi:site-specific DNA-methyltransferase (adenine-specific)